MIKAIDELLNKITMYHLLFYYLIFLEAAAVGLSFLGILRYDPLAVLFDGLFLFGACIAINKVFSFIFKAPSNRDSSYITALILALIISPTSTPRGFLFLAIAALLATASKYLLTFNKRHIFNPAAIAVVLTSLTAGDSASWWVGSTAMLPFVLLGGILVIRKVRTTRLVLTFLVTTLAATAFYSWLEGDDVIVSLQKIMLSSALFFFATVMLCEPLTSPGTKGKQTLYGMLVGLLFPPQVHIASLYATPELALVIGNIFTFLAGPHFRVFPRFAQKIEIAPHTYDFVFETDKPLHFTAGQYVEWTMPHQPQDLRGTRRFFTIASSPTEQQVRLGIKFYDHGSTFKQALLGMTDKTPIAGTRLGGDFVLPRDPARKIVFIAGGIGVTPYRSMIKYLIDTKEQRDITLLYAANTTADFTYTDIFETARRQLSIKTLYIATDATNAKTPLEFTTQGTVSAELIRQHVPDYKERLFYISGPHGMVVAIESQLRALDIPPWQIKKDLFMGYA